MSSADLTLFSHVAVRAEAELDLAQAALVPAEPEYPGLDIAHYLEALDALGEKARQCLDGPEHASDPPLRRITRLLHDQLGFAGNERDYYDPRNSFLNEVLDRKTGIPITLATVVIEVARRAGVVAHGVCFPGHFLLRTPGPSGPLFLDPFDGRLAGLDELRAIYLRATGETRDPDPRLLEPAPKRQILARMLHNLRAIYTTRGDRERLVGVLERLHLLSPSDELEREIASLAPPAPAARTLN